MASDGRISRGSSFQSAKSNCQEKSKSCQNFQGFFCKTCTLALCRKCIQNSHEGHDWLTLEERAKECTDEADSYKEKLKDLIEKQNTNVKNLETMVTDSQINLGKKLEEIENRENILKDKVQEYSSELKRQCRVQHQDREESLQQLINQKKDEILTLQNCIEFFTSRLLSSSDEHIVENTHDIQLKIDSYRPVNFGSLKDGVQFIAGRNNFSEIHELLGSINSDGVNQDIHFHQQTQEINLQEVSRFKFLPARETTILFKVSDDMAFHQTENRKVQLSNNKGHSIQEFDIGRDPELSGHQLYTFTKLANDDLLFCCRNQKGLWRMDCRGWITCIIHSVRDFLQVYYPTGLLTLRDGNILICYTSKPFNYVKSSSGKVCILNVTINEESRSSPTFKLVKIFSHNEDSSSNMFKWPYRATENKNRDLCIVDFVTTESSVLKVIDRQGNLRFTYCGQFLSNPFLVTSVACDNHCRIIVNDNLNHRIHLLSPEGSFVKFIWNEPNSYPWALALSPSCSYMWIHFGKNTMRVFKYECPDSSNGNS